MYLELGTTLTSRSVAQGQSRGRSQVLLPTKGPNSVQRFIGECVLAPAVHDVIIGVCDFSWPAEKAVRHA